MLTACKCVVMLLYLFASTGHNFMPKCKEAFQMLQCAGCDVSICLMSGVVTKLDQEL